MLKSNFLNSNYLLMAVAVILGAIMSAVPYMNDVAVSGYGLEMTVAASVTAFASFSLALVIAYVSWNKEALELKASLKRVKQQ